MIMKYMILPLVAILIAVATPAYAEVYNVNINVDSNTNECLPNCIEPTLLQIDVGDSVTWTNLEHCLSDEERDLRAADGTYVNQHLWHLCERNYAMVGGNPVDGRTGVFDTGAILPDQTSREILFETAGEHEYFDPGHKWIQGKIIVGTITVEKEVEVEKEVDVIQEDGAVETEIITEIETTTEVVEPTFEQKPERPQYTDELLSSLYPNQEIRLMVNVGYDVNDSHYVYYISDVDMYGGTFEWTEDSGNTLNFYLDNPTTGLVVLKLPTVLIGETLAVVDENDKILRHTYADHDEYSIVEIQLDNSRFITLSATYVTPEYLGVVAVAGIISAVLLITILQSKKFPTLINM